MNLRGLETDGVPAPSDYELGSSPPKPTRREGDIVVKVRLEAFTALHRLDVLVNGINCGTLLVGELASTEIARRLLQPSGSVEDLMDALRAIEGDGLEAWDYCQAHGIRQSDVLAVTKAAIAKYALKPMEEK